MTTPTPETLAVAREVALKIVPMTKVFPEDPYGKVREDVAQLIAAALTQHARKLAAQMVRETGAEEVLETAKIRLENYDDDERHIAAQENRSARVNRTLLNRLGDALARLRALTEDKG